MIDTIKVPLRDERKRKNKTLLKAKQPKLEKNNGPIWDASIHSLGYGTWGIILQESKGK